MLNDIQSALVSGGVQAARIETLWWLMFWVSVTVQVAVLVAVVIAVRRRRGSQTPDGDDAGVLKGVTMATLLSIVILFGLTVASHMTGRALAAQRDETAMIIEVTAYQWWWNVEYQHPQPELRVRTANELHLPIGRTVGIKLLGSDVIHSFWIPPLHGKMDVIPGHSAWLWLRADRPGIYRGQCAEYCGTQHAHMAFSVIAEDSDAFERWLQAQRSTAPPPSTPEAQRGLELVQSGTCAMCHTVRGTAAGARTGPDLTHIATRSTLAAGTLPNTRDNLTRWIEDPQHIKPGVRMPASGLAADDLRAVVSYLELLK